MEEVIENPDRIEIDTSNAGNVIKPFKFTKDTSKSSLTILNQSIENIDINEIWNNTTLHICADGGANRLYEYGGNERSKFIPDFIVGDLDLITDEVKQYYKEKGTKIIPQVSQYASDFMKSMNLILLYFNGIEILDVDEYDGLSKLMDQLGTDLVNINSYILNGLGGRFDQSIHSINQIHILNQQFPTLKNVFINEQDIVFMIPKGRNLISYNSITDFYKGSKFPVIGLLPFSPCTINSWGLKWDVRNWKSSIHGKVSSSNGIVSTNGIIIECDEDLVVNIERS